MGRLPLPSSAALFTTLMAVTRAGALIEIDGASRNLGQVDTNSETVALVR